jgi:hypothetical protein
LTAGERTKGSAPNGSMHYQNFYIKIIVVVVVVVEAGAAVAVVIIILLITINT